MWLTWSRKYTSSLFKMFEHAISELPGRVQSDFAVREYVTSQSVMLWRQLHSHALQCVCLFVWGNIMHWVPVNPVNGRNSFYSFIIIVSHSPVNLCDFSPSSLSFCFFFFTQLFHKHTHHTSNTTHHTSTKITYSGLFGLWMYVRRCYRWFRNCCRANMKGKHCLPKLKRKRLIWSTRKDDEEREENEWKRKKVKDWLIRCSREWITVIPWHTLTHITNYISRRDISRWKQTGLNQISFPEILIQLLVTFFLERVVCKKRVYNTRQWTGERNPNRVTRSPAVYPLLLFVYVTQLPLLSMREGEKISYCSQSYISDRCWNG